MAEQRVARLSDVPEGRTHRVVVEGVEVLLCNVGGEIFAIEDVCTHDGAPLDQGELDRERIICPRHGAIFDVRTGAVLGLPAVVPLPSFPVRIDGDEIYVAV